MKKLIAVLLCCSMLCCSMLCGGIVALAIPYELVYDEKTGEVVRVYEQVDIPDIKLAGKSRILDKGLSMYEQYTVELVVSGGSASVTDIMVYNGGNEGDWFEFDLDKLPDITLERINIVQKYEWLGPEEENSLIGKYPLKLSHNADGVGTGDVEYVLGASGLDLTLQPGAYLIAVTPKDGSFMNPFGITGWNPALCLFGSGNLDEFGFATDDTRIAVIMAVETGSTYQEAYDDASWKSASDEFGRYNNELIERKAEETRKAAEYATKPITLKVDGKTIPCDSPPVIEDGRTLVPARALVEALGGYYVDWDPVNQMIYVINRFTDEPKIEMTINSKVAYVQFIDSDGMPEMRAVQMDVPPKVINNRTMIPARFVSERLYCNVSWDADSKTVVVESTQ